MLGASAQTPLNEQPITVVMKAMKQKTYRQAHCWECGMPFMDIVDKIVTVFDGTTPVETYKPDEIGLIDVHCSRHQCKQHYRLEFAQ